MANLLVVEDDRFLRVVALVLDPNASRERYAAYADFFSHDEPGFRRLVRARCAATRMGSIRPRCAWSKPQDELRANLADCRALIVEGLSVGATELAAAPHLRAVQKYGVDLRRIDAAACAARGISRAHHPPARQYRLRRACDHADADARAQGATNCRAASASSALAEIGYPYRPFDRRHTPNSNWGRVPGLRILYGSTVGIVGIGEIGREFALRAAAFGMRILYTQRTPAARSRRSSSCTRPTGRWTKCSPKATGSCRWCRRDPPRVTSSAPRSSRSMKRGARIVNVSRPDVIDRAALIDALKSGQVGGFALDPLYEAPGRSDDELLRFPNVILTPHIAAQPRFNALDDLYDMITRLGRELAGS